MRFAVDRAVYYEADEVLSAYPILKEYEPKIDFPYKIKSIPRLTVEITDLVEFRRSIGRDIILTTDFDKDNTPKVTIYDDYIE